MDLWYFLLLISVGVIVRVDSLTAPIGFVSIDCGISSNTSYSDIYTTLTYVSDDEYTDTGINYKIAPQYTSNSLHKQSLTVRSFPNGTRNCYTFRSLLSGSKYLIRATFLYGNYDNLNKFPTFDVYLGVDLWATLKIGAATANYSIEVLAFAASAQMQVCLVNKGLGTPFISELDLRLLNDSIYTIHFTSSTYLVLVSRWNLGASNPLIRYPADPYDRIWLNYSKSSWTNISTSSTVLVDPTYEVPSVVMQTACVPSKAGGTLDISWSSENTATTFYIALHFSEIQSSSGTPQFNLYINSDNMFNNPFSPGYLSWNWAAIWMGGYTQYDMSLKSTANATLPPILNAMQLYTIESVTSILTSDGDVTTINSIKANYQLLNKGWSGDPCLPSNLTWPGIKCAYSSSDSPRITELNVSSSGLDGALISAFGDLNALTSLDLSRNKLSGPIPNSLDQLTYLTFMDLSGNKLTGSLPPNLEQRVQNGTLELRNVSIPTCSDTNSCHTKKKISTILIIIVVLVIVILVVVGVILGFFLMRRRRNEPVNPNPQQEAEQQGNTPPINYPPGVAVYHGPRNDRNANNPNENNRNLPFQHGQVEPTDHVPIHNKQFSYREITVITDKFQTRIGTGGFGNVYSGRLQNGTRVAVKLRSNSSPQGIREFMAEVQNLAKLHHKNLVTLVGYCNEGGYMALVYEFMSEGTFHDKLRGYARELSWKQRLHIAQGAAQGLEYLHKSCNPPLIHRDVKTNNILLTPTLEAKLADFGLSRAFDGDSDHVSTRIIGTPGYLDPEYGHSSHLTEKSDVYSFGVVLLEIVTGHSPYPEGSGGKHISKFVQERLSNGDIESIADPKMMGQYDINSVWKVADVALRCTGKGSRRPTMSTVVAELEESMKLEISSERPNLSNLTSDISHSSLEMAYVRGMTDVSGPVAR